MAIRWGIIGCGDVTEVKSGPGFQKARDSQLVAVMRRDGKRAADYALRHGVPRWYDDADALINDPEVNAVYIATPVAGHADYALRVCAAGKPAYVEKPMARSAIECRRIVDAFASANLPLFAAYYRRGLPRFVKAREIVASGRLGRIAAVYHRCSQPRHAGVDPKNLEWRLNCEQSGGGVFMDLGCHTLDVIDYIAGPIARASGIAANLASPYDVEDNVVMHWQHESGATGTGSWNFAAAVSEDLIVITGTDGRLSLSTFGVEPVKLELRDGSAQEFDLPHPPHVQQPLIQSIVDELLGRGTCPSTGQSALRTAVVMDSALDSYYGGRADEFWNRPQSWPGRRG